MYDESFYEMQCSELVISSVFLFQAVYFLCINALLVVPTSTAFHCFTLSYFTTLPIMHTGFYVSILMLKLSNTNVYDFVMLLTQV